MDSIERTLRRQLDGFCCKSACLVVIGRTAFEARPWFFYIHPSQSTHGYKDRWRRSYQAKPKITAAVPGTIRTILAKLLPGFFLTSKEMGTILNMLDLNAHHRYDKKLKIVAGIDILMLQYWTLLYEIESSIEQIK
jgi:hypothetical protein